ncbi:MAG: hypothetical protein SPJ17_03265 [Anaeroplasma sp.]|uniref:hypothetical protein n=1 Tax=Anaeroplasma sp. TaxID=1872523 RepID=UPI002A9112F6|nr:hypothetical protein [Anaeroplasma sp.]MDY5982689.1 hypothetical protein [Anaeroplasma sp.]
MWCSKNIKTSLINWAGKVLYEANLPHFTIHSLRYTNIALQIASGVPLITAAGRAGHSRTSTTTDIYSHFIGTSDNVAANVIDSMFEKKNDQKSQALLKLLNDMESMIYQS